MDIFEKIIDIIHSDNMNKITYFMLENAASTFEIFLKFKIDSNCFISEIIKNIESLTEVRSVERL